MTRVFILGALAVLALRVLVLARAGFFRERHALRWILSLVAVGVLFSSNALLDWLADLSGVSDPTNLAFGVILFGLAMVSIWQEREISGLRDDLNRTVQELALRSPQSASADESSDGSA